MSKKFFMGFLPLFFLVFFTARAYCETMYVTDLMQIMVRTGKGLDHKVIAMLESGKAVEVLVRESDWARVKLSDGKEGWVLSRFLTPTEPRSVILKKLRRTHQGLTEQVESLLTENRDLKDTTRNLQEELQIKQEELNRMKTDYEALRKEASDYLKLKTAHKESIEKLKQLAQKADTLEKELSGSQKYYYLWWFLAGGGVLLVGFLLGASSRRKRRHSTLR